MDCRANMLGNEVAVAMFYTFYYMFMRSSLHHAIWLTSFMMLRVHARTNIGACEG